MARKRSRSGGGRGQASKGMFSGIWLILLAGALLAFFQGSGIMTVEDAYKYSKSWSDKVKDDCGVAQGQWNCGPDGLPKSSKPDNSTPTLKKPAIKALNKDLKSLSVKEPENVAYDRGEWSHWSSTNGSKCDARVETLKAQGSKVKTDPKNDCRVVSGEWIDPYSKTKITDSSHVDIDHVIPLSWAAKNGGQSWPETRKKDFANDMSHLIASSRTENRGKGDKGPGSYMPPEKDYHCQYAQIWVKTAVKYKLSMPSADKAALQKAIATC